VLNALRLADCFDGVISVEDMRMFGHHRPKPDARMFRHMAARLKVPPHRCTLVEDTLEHQKSARSVGMRTVWMQRYWPAQAGVRPSKKPAYVCARIKSLQRLLAL
jgi:putative hydrolase of the HAD superfamily